MIKTYNINYPCEVISSFYDNYFGVHKYDLIKKITLRNSLSKSNEEDDVLKLFIFFQLFFAVHQDEIKEKIFTFFGFAFKSKPTNKFIENINTFKLDNDYSWFNENINNLKRFNQYEAFALFLLCTLFLNNVFGYSCVIPTNLIEINSQIKDYKIKEYFNIGFVTSLLKKDKIDLKKSFITFIHKNEAKFKSYGIREIYLFGSINSEEYHDSSDFDLVVRYKDGMNYCDLENIDNKIRKKIRDKFKRDTDIINYDDYISIRSLETATRIL